MTNQREPAEARFDIDRWMAAPPPRRRPMTRRELLRNAGLGALGLSLSSVLAACAKKEEAGGGTGPSAKPTELPPLAHELTVAQWPLYIDRAKGGHRPTLEAFEKETGIKVDYEEIINDNQAFFAKLTPQLQQGVPTGWDIIALSDWVVNRMRRVGWVAELDWSLLPTVDANMLNAFRDPAYDPGNAHSAPWQGGVTGIAYYPELCGGKITSFSQLWDQKLAGHVGMLTEMVDAMTLTLLMLGKDPQTATIEDAQAAQQKLLEQRDTHVVRQYYGQDYLDALVRKDTWASMAWSGDIFYYKYLGGAPDLEFVVPEEGGVIWTGPLSIPAGAEHPRDAHAFMDFYFRPEIAVQVTDWVLYMTPVKGVQELMAQKAEENTGKWKTYYETLSTSPLLFPPEDPAAANLYEYKALAEDEYQQYSDLFEQVVQG